MKACNWLCKAFNPCVFNRHSYLCHRFLQKLFDFWFRWNTVESCYFSFALILVVMGSDGLVVSVFICFILVGDCLFHFRDSFIDLFVSVVAFFLHFRNGCVHSIELGSDWLVDCLHEMFLSCYLRILSQHQIYRQVTSCLVTEPSWLRTMVPTLSFQWTFFNDETTNVTKKTKKLLHTKNRSAEATVAKQTRATKNEPGFTRCFLVRQGCLFDVLRFCGRWREEEQGGRRGVRVWPSTFPYWFDVSLFCSGGLNFTKSHGISVFESEDKGSFSGW